jgi:4-alpha-glucanotransferase
MDEALCSNCEGSGNKNGAEIIRLKGKPMKRRGSGILLHLTSLPTIFGIGDMGPSARQFLEFLTKTKQRYWQILPINPTDSFHHNSPYHSSSAFAFNPPLISPEVMIENGYLENSDLSSVPKFPPDKVAYSDVAAYKEKLFSKAFETFKAEKRKDDYDRFCSENDFWLEDFVLFQALKKRFKGRGWSAWPKEIRDRHSNALQIAREELHDLCDREKFLQYLFFNQWISLKADCYQRGIHIIGDIPIYINHDSADVWVYHHLFKLDDKRIPAYVAGVPPDYFSKTGQLWGNPVYDWGALKSQRYEWWIRRIAHNLKLFDFVRLDHFRVFVRYWEVSAAEKTATKGQWVDAPVYDFFDVLLKRFPTFPVFAEDLGYITADVRQAMSYFKLAGMKVLLFAFDETFPNSTFLPHNFVKDCVVYTGTHDNNTVRGWFEEEANREAGKRLCQYLGRELPVETLHWELIRLAMMSVGNTTIFPMQDILGLGESARMNRPATRKGNWCWRMTPNYPAANLIERLAEMTETYDRA